MEDGPEVGAQLVARRERGGVRNPGAADNLLSLLLRVRNTGQMQQSKRFGEPAAKKIIKLPHVVSQGGLWYSNLAGLRKSS